MPKRLRHLLLILGDQLNFDSAAFDGFDKSLDAVWMAEVAEESTHVWSHKARIVIFLAAMRHFRQTLVAEGISVDYRAIDDPQNGGTFAAELSAAIERLSPQKLIVVLPGEQRVLESLQNVAHESGLPLHVVPDRHFYTTPEEFADHAQGRKQLRLEFFYRELRRRFDVLMDGNTPEGGKWNYDSDNRGSFKKTGPGTVASPQSFPPDKVTAEVMETVETKFADHPGSLAKFDWPVTRDDAQRALDDFIQHRLSTFGDFQDAMWTDEPYLYHSKLSTALNLKLLDPREVVEAAVDAYRGGKANLSGVEGFVRQILGWREYVRGIYFLYMPEYLERNALGAQEPLPDWFWTGETEMHCLQQAIGQTLEYGYAHHIQRLMVTGLFCLLLGVDPKRVHEWYLAVYVDAIEWVELPNSLGMSQFADGGVMASKPYVATGKYIKRMSNYCQSCQFNPDLATGEDACPFTTMYWDFLQRHQKQLQGNNRMSLQLRNLQRKEPQELVQITDQAERFRQRMRS